MELAAAVWRFGPPLPLGFHYQKTCANSLICRVVYGIPLRL